ncbi:MAG: multicopper oxidase domain-containing protein [Rhodothermales bacterium]
MATDNDCKPLSLYCIELVPTVAFEGVRSAVELARPPSAFGVAVSRDGHQRYRLIVHTEGLPSPPAGHAYVLWSMPLVLDPVVRQATIVNGEVDAGEIALNRFMLLVTLEPEDAAADAGRTGPIVMRGRSPSSRMEPHDLFQLSAFADPIRSEEGEDGSEEAGEGEHQIAGNGHQEHGHGQPVGSVVVGVWPVPPMHAGVRMPAAMHTLKPTVSPWKPDDKLLEWAGVDRMEDLPRALPREVYHLKDGDELTLHAEVVRKTLNGREMAFLGYNRQIPGPLLWVDQNVTLQVTFKNDTPFPSSIHWHGLRHDYRFDGVPGLTQEAVPPGGSFEYTVHFPDAGLFWYHPHHREDIQQELGLYGNMLVNVPESDAEPMRTEVIVLDDLALADGGTDNTVVPFGTESTNYAFMGRFGTVPLINGEPEITLTARTDERVRLLVTNVSNTRTWNVSVEGHALAVVGSDLGLYAAPVWEESMAIAPAERYTADLEAAAPGRYAITNRIQSIDHTEGRFFPEVDTLGWLVVEGAAAAKRDQSGLTPAMTAQRTARDRASVDSAAMDSVAAMVPAEPSHEIELFIRTRNLPPLVDWLLKADQSYFHPVEWSGTMPMMNWSASAGEVEWVMREASTGRENMAIQWRFERGTVHRIRIHNLRDTPHAMQHPIHLHGQRFLVLSYNGRAVEHRVWKDTVLIPAGMTADIAVEFTNPGRWMMHCHIAEHLETGMMAGFIVE